jgi:hypothetical protein
MAQSTLLVTTVGNIRACGIRSRSLHRFCRSSMHSINFPPIRCCNTYFNCVSSSPSPSCTTTTLHNQSINQSMHILTNFISCSKMWCLFDIEQVHTFITNMLFYNQSPALMSILNASEAISDVWMCLHQVGARNSELALCITTDSQYMQGCSLAAVATKYWSCFDGECN